MCGVMWYGVYCWCGVMCEERGSVMCGVMCEERGSVMCGVMCEERGCDVMCGVM